MENQQLEIIKLRKVNKRELAAMVNIIVCGIGKYVNSRLLKHSKTKSLSNPLNYFIIIKNKDDIVGFAMYRLEKELCFLYEIHVAHDLTGKGYGQVLMNEFVGSIKEYKKIQLCVHKNNQIAQKFYQKNGFVKDEDYEDVTTFRMTKFL